jgi:hypothetical protein
VTHIQQRRDDAATWASENPVLFEGEAGHETDTGKWKLGDGVTAWNALPYKSDVDSVAGKTGAVTLEVTDVDGAAPIDSPEFTGTPMAPTQASDNDSTRLATTAFVQAVADLLRGAAPSDLDTLAKIAASIGNDPDFIGSVNYSLSTYAPLDSPVLTGTPGAPTPPPGDNDSTIPTTSWVNDAIDGRVDALGVGAIYTPTISNFSVSSSTARYTAVNDLVVVTYRCVISAVTGVMSVSLPFSAVAAPSSLQVIGTALGSDISANAYAPGVVYLNGANNVSFLSAAGVWGSPFTWAAGDTFSFTLTYERAPV